MLVGMNQSRDSGNFFDRHALVDCLGHSNAVVGISLNESDNAMSYLRSHKKTAPDARRRSKTEE